MEKPEISQSVRREIEALHEFFVGWFGGSLAETAFDPGFLTRFSNDLVFIPPAGRLLGVDDLAATVRQGYASNPNFKIAIRNVRVRRQFGDYVIATYEEWQRNALASIPPDNGRLATVVFKGPEPWKWLHIHETWLPPDVMSAGPYDF